MLRNLKYFRRVITNWSEVKEFIDCRSQHKLSEKLKYEKYELFYNYLQDKVVIFHHIPKTAGMTLNEYLIKFYPIEHTYHHNVFYNKFSSPQEQLQHIKYYWGHRSWDQIDSIKSNKYLFTLLRKPRDRLISWYNFINSASLDDCLTLPSHLIGKLFSFDDFFHLNNKYTNIFIDNVYVRQLISGGFDYNNLPVFSAENEQHYLSEALQNLYSFDFVGLVEQFDLSQKIICEDIGLPIVKQLKKQNETRAIEPHENHGTSMIPMINKTDFFSASTEERLSYLTRLDEIIYAEAEKILQRRKADYSEIFRNMP